MVKPIQNSLWNMSKRFIVKPIQNSVYPSFTSYMIDKNENIMTNIPDLHHNSNINGFQ